MAFSYFFNMEQLTLTIAEKHMKNMTNDNLLDDAFLDDDKIRNNLENGFIVITQLNCYFESFLNSILNNCINCANKDLLRCSVIEKINIIFLFYKRDLKKIKESHHWQTYKRITVVRNEMIHFKEKISSTNGGTPTFKIGKEDIKNFFTLKEMEKAFFSYQELAKLIANELGLKISNEVEIFECDAKNGLTTYVHN